MDSFHSTWTLSRPNNKHPLYCRSISGAFVPEILWFKGWFQGHNGTLLWYSFPYHSHVLGGPMSLGVPQVGQLKEALRIHENHIRPWVWAPLRGDVPQRGWEVDRLGVNVWGSKALEGGYLKMNFPKLGAQRTYFLGGKMLVSGSVYVYIIYINILLLVSWNTREIQSSEVT